MTRPTRRQLERAIRYIRESDTGHYRDDSQANARMLLAEYDYQRELLRRAERWVSDFHTYKADCECRACRIIADIRETIGEEI